MSAGAGIAGRCGVDDICYHLAVPGASAASGAPCGRVRKDAWSCSQLEHGGYVVLMQSVVSCRAAQRRAVRAWWHDQPPPPPDCARTLPCWSQQTSLKSALDQQLDSLQTGELARGAPLPGDLLEAEWSDIWDVAHEARSRSEFVADMQRLRKRYSIKVAERAQQRAGQQQQG